jgi:signal transduction histidine kinase
MSERRRGRRLPLAVKLGAPILLITVTTFALLGYLAVRQAIERVDAGYLADSADVVALLRERFPTIPDDVSEIDSYLSDLAQARPTIERIQLVREAPIGNPFVWASSLPSDISRDFDSDFIPAWGAREQHEVQLDGAPAFMVSKSPNQPSQVAAVATYFSLDPRTQAIQDATRTILAQTVFVLVLQLAGIALASYLVVLRRLKRMGVAAAAVAEGDLGQHLPEGDEPAGRDELINVAREFDHMIDAVRMRTVELEDAAERERLVAEELRELDRVKNLLLHAVSHDLRSPITSIMGSAATLEKADELKLSEEDRTMLTRSLSVSAGKMNRLVQDILDVDRLEQGIVTPRRLTTDLAALVEKMTTDAADGGNHSLHTQTEPISIAVDAPKVERIIDNLISNAIKHTPRGTDIWVRTRPAEGGALIVVEDSGPGVPDPLKATIFEPFTKGDPEALVPGVGVGLSLVARFAELHGGRAWVEDRPGGGASFHVFLADGPEDPEASEEV